MLNLAMAMQHRKWVQGLWDEATKFDLPVKFVANHPPQTGKWEIWVQAYADTIIGKAIKVSDGDTITVLDKTHTQHKIRLAGIDAPEKNQAFGQRAKESLSDLVSSKAVTVETGKTDRYGREVGKVLVDGIDSNLVQVQKGFVWHC